MKNIANKERRLSKGQLPYASWIDPATGWKYSILKSWQGDNSKEYSRWFMYVEGFSKEMGDEYCSNVRPGLNRAGMDVTFDETVWSTLGEFHAWVWGEQ